MASVVVPDKNSSGTRLAVSWGVGNALVLGPKSDKQQRQQQSSSGLKGPVSLHEVRWEVNLYQPIFRKLVNESVATFLSLQSLSAAAAGDQPAANNVTSSGIPHEQLVRISRQYRSIMRDCQEQMDALAETTSALESAQHTAESEVLYKLELIWNLAEILMVDTRPGGCVMNQLLHWISLHFRECEEGARSVVSQSSDSPEDHVEYWDTLQEFVLQGRMDQARKLLSLHSDFSSDMFLSMDELLRKMPFSAANLSMPEFELQWRNWQLEVVGRLQAGEFAVYPQLNTIAEILAGREEALNGVADKCETWYQWMVYRLLYINPGVKGYDLGLYAQQAVDRFGGLQSMTALDSVLLGIIELDVPEVIRELCLTLDNFWFPAHLLDLVHHAGIATGGGGIESPDVSALGAGLREFLLLDYATCLMSHNSLWQLGVLYFDHCPVAGRQRLEALLERVPLTSDYKASKVISVASSRGLHSVVASTCKVMGMRALALSDTGSAMAWALKSQDAKFTTFLADKLLAEFTESGRFTSVDLLDTLGASIVVSDRLTFLGKYREFIRLREEADYQAAASLLHSLLWSRLAPKYFWVTLLIDSIPFLTADQVLFSSEENYHLLQCLQDLTEDASLPEKQKVLLEEEEKRIRLALAKNLALALIKEGDAAASQRY